jgi:hypothetical protein
MMRIVRRSSSVIQVDEELLRTFVTSPTISL